MQKILLLSTIYPLPQKDNKGTPVCHFFTKEWIKQGYDVRVIHVQAVYPRFFYWLAKFNTKKIAAKTGAIVYTKRLNTVERYDMDSVPIMRIPVFKPIPHGKFLSKSVKKAVNYIVNECNNNDFIPDIIIGHFPNPQIELLSLLKKEFIGVKTCIVMHGEIEILKRVYNSRLPELLHDIDIWGFRSKTILEEFENSVSKISKPFICYSGIPESYITKFNTHTFERPLQKFVYVGLMIDRKYPDKVLDALYDVYGNTGFHLDYIGEGQQLAVIKEKINNYHCHNLVSLLGRIPRDKIKEEYDKADCMIMISRAEAYGLVYLEAMARGCITIASKREGFDGVIVDGKNGFLCTAGDSQELASIIRRINELSPAERQQISEEAIATAKELTDEKAAKRYIDEVIERM